MPAVEVRCENLTMEAKVTVGSRALPTVLNSYRNFFEVSFQRYHGWHYIAIATTVATQAMPCVCMHAYIYTRIAPINVKASYLSCNWQVA